MPLLTVSMVEITCDWPGCTAGDLFDPPQPEAVALVKSLGWGIAAGRKGKPDSARCPAHKGKWIRKATRT